MEYELTAAVQRVFAEAARWSDRAAADELLAPSLLLGLLAEAECHAAIVLARHGIEAETVCRQWPCLTRRADQPATPRHSAEVRASLAAAARCLRHFAQPLALATEHVLLGLVSVEHETGLWLREQGLDPDALEAEIHERYGYWPDPLPLEEESREVPLPLEEQSGEAAETLPPPGSPSDRTPLFGNDETALRLSFGETASENFENQEQTARIADRAGRRVPESVGVLRVLDAAWNRAREGLRVVEDYTRFVLDDRHLTEQLKQLRHELAAALESVPLGYRLAARETQADVGTQLSTPREHRRQDPLEVATANFIRVQEGLRSLEEFGKLLAPEAAARLKQLRYQTYTLHRAVEITRTSLERLGRATLYVLLDGQGSPDRFASLVDALVGAGVHVLQLRDKRLDDRRLLQRARQLRRQTQGTGTLFVMNDRPDLAVLAGADGVHVGQEELTVKDVRAIVGPRMLIGVSTHSFDQARQAVLDGADYLGVGPTFPSGTKEFDHFPGLDFLRQVAAEIRLPAFAIGGINRENLPQVLATGIGRVAVSGAVAGASDPARAAKELLAGLERRGQPDV